jgi:hypothetical protein
MACLCGTESVVAPVSVTGPAWRHGGTHVRRGVLPSRNHAPEERHRGRRQRREVLPVLPEVLPEVPPVVLPVVLPPVVLPGRSPVRRMAPMPRPVRRAIMVPRPIAAATGQSIAPRTAATPSPP